MCSERTKVFDKSNKHVCCPLCESKETWKHVLLCENIKDEREDWTKKLINKLNDAEKGKSINA